jgi:hypothetical protein
VTRTTTTRLEDMANGYPVEASMAMPIFDRSRFLRILNLTESPNDFEALNAVRRANAMLHAAGLPWEKLIVVPPPPCRGKRRPALGRRLDILPSELAF